MLRDSRTPLYPLWPTSGSNFQSLWKICWCKSQTEQASWVICWHGCLHEVWIRNWIHLFSVAYENVAGAHRLSWRVVSSAEKMREGSNSLRKQRERRQWALRYMQVIYCLFWTTTTEQQQQKTFIPSVSQAQTKSFTWKWKETTTVTWFRLLVVTTRKDYGSVTASLPRSFSSQKKKM